MHTKIVGTIETFAVVFVGKRFEGAITFQPGHSPITMLTEQQMGVGING
jgi:hypothetical protein